MLRKLIICLFCVIILFSCSRSTESNSISSQSSGRYEIVGAESTRENVVSNKFQGISLKNRVSKSLDGISYVPPLVLYDQENNVQYVFVLLADQKVLELVRYKFVNNQLIKDIDFSVKLDASSDYYKIHQMAIGIDPDTNSAYIFIAHKNGLYKANAITGVPLTSDFFNDSTESGLRVFVYPDDNNIYFQSSTSVFKLGFNLEIKARSELSGGELGGAYNTSLYLPLKIITDRQAGARLYVERSNRIYCFKIGSLNVTKFHPCVQVSKSVQKNGRVGGMFIFHKELYFSEIVDEHPFETYLHCFANSCNSDFFDLYYNRINPDWFLTEGKRHFGDSYRTAVVSYWPFMLLPAPYFRYLVPFTEKENIHGIFYFNKGEESSVVERFMYIKDDRFKSDNKDNYKKVSRFMFYDNTTKLLFSVFNFDIKTYSGGYETELCLTPVTFNEGPAIEDKKCDLLEDKTDSILNVALGDGLILLTTEKGELHYIF
jgi:hypothetical protein